MNKFIFNTMLLSMLFLLGACSAVNDPSDGDDIAKNIISNTDLEVFDGTANDQSTAIGESQGTAGIDAKAITLKVKDGTFEKSAAAVTLDSADNTAVKQISAISKSVKQAVDSILKVSDNAVVGLSTEATVDVKMSGTSTATATVTIKAVNDYMFEDKATFKTMTITLTGDNFEQSLVDESAFVVPAISISDGIAGVNSFTIPAGFATAVTDKVAVSFHNRDNEYSEKKAAIKKAMFSMNITSKQVVVSSVGDFENDDSIEVTFKPADGYKFTYGENRKVKIYFSGNFQQDFQKIVGTPFTTRSIPTISGEAGIPAIEFDNNFKPKKLSSFDFHKNDKGSFDRRQKAAIKSLNKMFKNQKLFYGLPEGVSYPTDSTVNVKIKYWNDGHAILIVTLVVQDNLYIFENGRDHMEVEIKFTGTGASIT